MEKQKTEIEKRIPICIQTKEGSISATLNHTKTALAFVEMLPCTLEMHRYDNREYYGYMDETFPLIEEQVSTMQDGNIVYWIMGPGIAIFFDTSIHPTLSSDVIVIGKMDDSFKQLHTLDSLETMTITLAGGAK